MWVSAKATWTPCALGECQVRACWIFRWLNLQYPKAARTIFSIHSNLPGCPRWRGTYTLAFCSFRNESSTSALVAATGGAFRTFLPPLGRFDQLPDTTHKRRSPLHRQSSWNHRHSREKFDSWDHRNRRALSRRAAGEDKSG